MAEKRDSHWIEHAHLHEGALRNETRTRTGGDISAKRLRAAAHSKNGTIRKQAELAETLKKIHESPSMRHKNH
jgi:hypothetical protein